MHIDITSHPLYELLNRETPYIQNGLDYSDFHPLLKLMYRNAHIKDLIDNLPKSSKKKVEPMRLGGNEISHHKKMILELLYDDEKRTRYILEHHLSLAFHEALKPGGAKAHYERCKNQYELAPKKKIHKKQKSYQLTFKPYTGLSI